MIKAYSLDNKTFIFNFKDASNLRERHRIVGSLIGCFPLKPRQNCQLGLPLQLLPEEATLLKEKGIIELIQQRNTIKVPTDEEIKQYQEHCDQIYSEQNELSIAWKNEDVAKRRESIIAGKKAKKMKLRQQEEGQTRASVNTEESDSELQAFVDQIKHTDMPRSGAYVQIPTASWRSQDETPAKWLFPHNEMETLRYRVFKEFWEQGYFLTGGCKFGGDFLVYPGDPARYHSYYIAVCIPPKEKLSMLHLSTIGRLGVTVKKTVVICSVGKDDKLTFTSLNWTHIS